MGGKPGRDPLAALESASAMDEDEHADVVTVS